MTHDKKQPGLPVVEVDQAFPLMTTDGVSRATGSSGLTGDQGPAVSAAIRDVLGWRPRVQDPKAFTAALSASFALSTFEDHVVAKYVPRGVAVQADLGGVTGGQASLYLRAKAAHDQITRMLESLQPLRTDADSQDCEAYRGLVRDSVRRIVMELGREGGPRVALVDSAFGVLTGYRPVAQPAAAAAIPGGPAINPLGKQRIGAAGATPPARPSLLNGFWPATSVGVVNGAPGSVPTAIAEIDPDTVPGQLGALRDRFGLDDDHVNTVDEEKQRTSYWTLVELVTDLQRSWDTRRLDFTLGAGNGFLGTDLVQISRLLAASSEQVDELEAVLDSVLVSGAERQTVVLDRTTGLTLDDLVQWLRVFVTEDGPNIIRDSGRDGLVSSFTPTAAALLLTVRDKLVRRLVPCGGSSCAGGCHCGCRGMVTCIPLGCCTPLPPGMYAGRVKIAVSTLCGLIERLTAKAIRIGRYAGVVLLDLSVVPFDNDPQDTTDFVRIEVRGLHLRPTYVPALVSTPGTPPDFGSLILPLQGSASADDDTLVGIFQRNTLPFPLQDLLNGAGARGVLMAASEVPLAIVDGELGRMVQGPTVTTWPRLQPASFVAGDDGPDTWDTIDPNQRFIPQSPPDPVDPEAFDECQEDCGEDCEDCDCGCHPLDIAKAGIQRVQKVINDADVQKAFVGIQNLFDTTNAQMPVPARLWDVVKTDQFTDLLDALVVADGRASKTATARAQVAVKAKVVAGAVAEPVIHAEAVPAAVDARAARESADAAQAILIEAQAAADRAAEKAAKAAIDAQAAEAAAEAAQAAAVVENLQYAADLADAAIYARAAADAQAIQAAADDAQAAVIADALQGGTEVAQTGATPKGAETFETADYGAQSVAESQATQTFGYSAESAFVAEALPAEAEALATEAEAQQATAPPKPRRTTRTKPGSAQGLAEGGSK